MKVSKDALYNLFALDVINYIAMGRPKKATELELGKPTVAKHKAAKPKPGKKGKA
jgi:hypothetical protein